MNQRSLHLLRHGTRGLEIVALAVLILAIPTQVFAVLGGSEASVQTDQAQMHASLRSTSGASYTVHELRTPTGIVIREFAAGGTVFAIAWQGPWPPDLSQLLGSYFDLYQQELSQNRNTAGRKPIHIQRPELVVSSSGHPRSFMGHAYVPGMLPQGVQPGEIR